MKDAVIVLTGALGTLGQAQATLLAQQGATLLLLDRVELAEAGDKLAHAVGRGARYIGLDLNDLARAEAVVLEVAGGPPISVLINNAALIINRPFQEFSLVEYEDQIRVNSSAAFALTRAVAPGMKSRG